MFSFQTMNSKRQRDDDSDSEDADGCGYERQHLKKSRTWFSDPVSHGDAQKPSSQNLALRPSPTPPRLVSDIEAMTPAQSDYEDDSPNLEWGGIIQLSQPSDYDMEMDDDDFDITSQPPQSPLTTNLFMRPPMLNASLFGADAVNTNARIPTPIHPTFKRGGMNGLGFPTSGSAGSSLSTSNNNGMKMAPMQAPTVRKNHRQDMDEDRTRRMPSPISEDEDIPDTPTALTQSQLSRLSFSQANPADQMDTEQTEHVALVLPPTPKGRKRSGALTGMGRFTMGYRDDCEKCRQRVPGHYSHFL